MQNSFAQNDFPVSQNIYARLLRAYPAAHRAEYGAAMAQLFRDQCRDAWRDSGNWGLTRLWFRVLPDWASTSVRERIAALNERKTMNDKLASLSRDRTTPTAIFIRVAAVVFLITLMIATVITYLLPESYASTCKIKVENDQPVQLNSTNPFAAPYDPYFIQTTFEIIQSQLVLSNVIAMMNLNVEWGKKYFAGETLKTVETMEILKGRLILAPVKGTKLIAITVYSDDKNEAALIANAVAESYRRYRSESQLLIVNSGLKVVENQFASETNQISLIQSNVEHLRAVLDIRGDDAESNHPTPSISDEELKKYHADMLEKESKYQEQLTQWQRLQAINATNAPMLRDVLPLIAPDGSLSALLEQYMTNQQRLTQLTADPGTSSSFGQREQNLKKTLDEQINQRIAGIMAALEMQVTSLKASLDSIKQKVEEAKSNDTAQAAKFQPYCDEKAKLLQLRSQNELTQAKLLSLQLESKIPKTQMAVVTDPAEPSRTPVKPNKTLDIVMGAIYGIILGGLAGGAAAMLAARRGNRAAQNSPSA
jgi:uncharacterized protein involved in exopolysaccharide biosynthesis